MFAIYTLQNMVECVIINVKLTEQFYTKYL